MAGEHDSRFTLGLFVTVGILIAATGLIWLGAQHLLTGGKYYVSYFNEAVDTIDKGSPVKYQGVDVGSVTSIDIAPDHKLISVVIKVTRKNVVSRDTLAEVKTTGFTGMGFLNLYPAKPGEQVSTPKITFKPKYPVIPATSSQMGQLMSQASSILKDIKSIDFKGISDEVKATVKSAHETIAGSKMKAIIANVKSTSAHLDVASKKIAELTSKPSFQQMPSSARQALLEARRLISNLRQEIQAIKLQKIGGNVNDLTKNLDERTRRITAETERLTENLQKASETLDLLLDRIYSTPSDVLFSKPPSPRGKGQR